ncbi:DUF2155 domain-containing protein [Methylobacterium sp. 17Sr1-1]|uniref:DUF2155 domain-containing protein n=1 Tax=Methylobacterium sp. 17Sr1-1 TaxID=2202826 RepID=UPI000D6F8D17|nr:DUF2155 domain-containing protein [Methylobacterium sp. 17Sr1-1]AWN50997.1 DUF2155 domain-containing protein [Methylobacterium sp. 17Sr1-1]
MSRMTARRAAGAFLLLGGALLGTSAPAWADKIRNPTAVFSGLDKITGRIVSFEVAVDETVQFGALQLTPRVCYTRPPTESAKTTAFLEVDEVTLENKYRRIFTGWMFASSPGLHAIEHPIYDVWLVDCKGGTDIVAEPKEQEDAPVAAAKPEGRKRREQARGEEAPRSRQVNRQGQVDVEPLRGTPVQPRQSPSRRFFPTNDTPPPGADPMNPNPR